MRKAGATPAEYGICNVWVANVPTGVKVAPFVAPATVGAYWGLEPGPSGEVILLRVSVPNGRQPTVSPDMAERGPAQSNALIDARSGETVTEVYLTPADEAKIKAVLDTLKVGPWQPTGPAWPRTDTPPKSEVKEFPNAVEVATDYLKPTLRYREPEAGSGIFGGRMSFATRGDELRAYTCNSVVEIDGETGAILRREVVPEEEAMFQRFLEGVVSP